MEAEKKAGWVALVLIASVIAFSVGNAVQSDRSSLEKDATKCCRCEKQWEEQRERNRDQDWLNGIVRKHLGQSGVAIGNPPGAAK